MKLDIEFIKKWVNISEEELMMRLVKDAVELQKEAEANKATAEAKARLEDPTYGPMVLKFWRQVDYLRQYFTDDEIVDVAAKHLSVRDLTQEYFARGFRCKEDIERIEKHSNMQYLRHDRRHKFEEYNKNGWKREVEDEADVFLMANQYQSCHDGAPIQELLKQRFPYLKKYKTKIYSLSNSNDWIYIELGEDAHSLYCPVSALFEKDLDKIISTHLNYWNNYGHGKYDEREQTFIESDAVQMFLADVEA